MDSLLLRKTALTGPGRHLINLTALITPIDQDGGIDVGALSAVVGRIARSGADGLVIGGTTGETATLTPGERQALVKGIVRARDAYAGVSAAHGGPGGHHGFEIVYGWGGNSTRAMLEELDSLDLEGVSALLSVTPYYNRPTQEGLYQHYTALANRAPLPVILYNVPSRTGVNLLPETVGRLAGHPNIIGLKEAYTDPGQLALTMRAVRREHFYVLAGDDMMTPGLIAMGGHGCIGVMGNLFPRHWAGLFGHLMRGTLPDYADVWDGLALVNDYLYREGNPVGVKAAMAHLGLCGADVRLPLSPASEALRSALGQVLDASPLLAIEQETDAGPSPEIKIELSY